MSEDDNMDERYKILDSRVVFQGHIFKVSLDQVRMPGGDVVERERISHGGAVGIVPLTSKGQVLLVRQYRHAVRRHLLEIPAGKLDAGEDPESCARRELLEEVGATAGELAGLATFYNSPGYSSELFHLYTAMVSDELGAPQPDGHEEEDMEVVPVSLDEALALVDNGTICDAKSMIGLLLAERRLRRG